MDFPEEIKTLLENGTRDFAYTLHRVEPDNAGTLIHAVPALAQLVGIYQNPNNTAEMLAIYVVRNPSEGEVAATEWMESQQAAWEATQAKNPSIEQNITDEDVFEMFGLSEEDDDEEAV